MKRFIYIISIALFLFSCGKNDAFKIEGELSNLNDTTLYIAYEYAEENVFDTIITNNKGQFKAAHEITEDIQCVTIYFEDREKWITLYPEKGTTVYVEGDAEYPKLIQIKGGKINNKLNEFRNKVFSLLKEQTNLDNQTNNNQVLNNNTPNQLANINHELTRNVHDFVLKNPKEEASVILISDYFTDPENTNPAEELLNLLSPELNDYYVVKNLRSQIDKAKMSMVGAKAPAFDITNIYGKKYTPESFLDKHYIMAFTALWCDFCQTQIMMLDRISTEYHKDSLEIIMICLDDNSEDVLDLLKSDSIQWNLVIDSAGQSINMFEQYNVNLLPKCLLMDKEGIIRLRTSNGEELKQAVDEIFQ